MTLRSLIRPARGEDLTRILTLDCATRDAPHWSEKMYRDYVVPQLWALQHKALFVAMHDDFLQGYAAASSCGEEAELESIVVAAALRRAGLGRRLLGAVAAWAQQGKAQNLRLEVRSANVEAQAFYAAQGFTREGLRRAYYSDPADDAVLLRRDLLESPG